PTMELLPLVLVLLPATLATGIKQMALDMALESFDDQYRGCRSEMLKELPKLNRSEFTTNSTYSKVWANATIQRRSRPFPGCRLWPEQAIALRAYSMNTELYQQFNAAVRTAGRSLAQLHKFPFKVMHFLLTEALGDLRAAWPQGICLHVFRGVQGIRFTAKPGDIVHFGQFTSASLNKEVAKRFGTDTFFKVLTCHGAIIQDFSEYPEEEEVLIPPFETFWVARVTRQGAKTHIQLYSRGVRSNYNCAFSSGDIPGVGTPVA
ncbi:NARE ribosyltransferase, partial [Onychorhynchus coronatus]|nr:NARE ribosyltransferase [Onychorhynchus coronatus]